MTRLLLRTAILVPGLVTLLTGCGHLMNSDHQSVTIFSDPPDVKVTIDELLHVTAPGTVSLSRKGDHTALLEKEGYQTATLKIERTWSWWEIGNVSCLLFIFQCINSDRHDGGYWTFDDEVHVKLAPRAPAEPPKPNSP